jgi:hypothetical protein
MLSSLDVATKEIKAYLASWTMSKLMITYSTARRETFWTVSRLRQRRWPRAVSDDERRTRI